MQMGVNTGISWRRLASSFDRQVDGGTATAAGCDACTLSLQHRAGRCRCLCPPHCVLISCPPRHPGFLTGCSNPAAHALLARFASPLEAMLAGEAGSSYYLH